MSDLALLDRTRVYVDALKGLSDDRLTLISLGELRALLAQAELSDPRRYMRRPEPGETSAGKEVQS